MKGLLPALVVMAGLVGNPAQADDFGDARKLFEAGKYVEAVTLFRKAADEGVAKAQAALGLKYADGLGVPQDYAAASLWYRKAAEQGIALAQFNLAHMYVHGPGVPQDYAEAASWYRKAADQGFADAQFNLGNMYVRAQGVPQDFVQALMWASLAAASATDEEMRDDATRNRDFIAAWMTPAQIAEAQASAAAWKPIGQGRGP